MHHGLTWPVGGTHDQDLFPALQAIHLGEKLVHYSCAGTCLNGHDGNTTVGADTKPTPRTDPVICTDSL